MMQEFITNVRTYLELLYFVSGIVVAVVAIVALQQVRLLKLDIETRNERAAKERAIEAGAKYFSEFVPFLTVYFDECKNEKIPTSYKGSVTTFKMDSLPKNWLPDLHSRMTKFSWLPAINNLESIAAMFTTGVADGDTGFEIFGRTFCGAIQSHYDLIAVSNDAAPYGYYANIVKLYNIWSARLSRAELEASRDLIDEQTQAITVGTTPTIGPYRARSTPKR